MQTFNNSYTLAVLDTCALGVMISQSFSCVGMVAQDTEFKAAVDTGIADIVVVEAVIIYLAAVVDIVAVEPTIIGVDLARTGVDMAAVDLTIIGVDLARTGVDMVAVDLTIIGVDLARMEVDLARIGVEMAAEDLTAALCMYVDVTIVDVVAAAVTCVDCVMLQLVLDGNGSSWRYKQPQPVNVITPFPSNNWFSDISRVLSLQHFK